MVPAEPNRELRGLIHFPVANFSKTYVYDDQIENARENYGAYCLSDKGTNTLRQWHLSIVQRHCVTPTCEPKNTELNRFGMVEWLTIGSITIIALAALFWCVRFINRM